MQTCYFLSSDFLDLTLYQYGYEQCEPYHTFGPAMRNHYLIHCILSGKGQYITNYRGEMFTYELEAGQAFLIEPNTLIYYSADGNDPWKYMWIEFDGLKGAEYVKQAGLSLKKIGECFGGRDHSTIIHACEKIQKDRQEDPELNREIDALILELKNRKP